MNKIDLKFKRLRKNKKKAFVVYISSGDPDINTTKDLVLKLQDSGVDIIELGIPFSDPVADGPVIQNASIRALDNGVTLSKIFSMLLSIKDKVSVPLVFMTYYNPVFHYGVDRFLKTSKECGVDGLIIPDMPMEEAKAIMGKVKKYKMSLILLVSPTTENTRLKEIAKNSGGFIYYVSLKGVTGARKSLSTNIKANVKKIKRFTDKPVCVGFGVSNSRQAKEISKYADGVIVGSAVIKVLEKNLGKKDLVEKVGQFAKSISRALKKVNNE